MITITIEGVDRSRFVEYTSLRITNILTNQPDTCDFVVRRYGDRTYRPDINDEIVITDDSSERIFAGNIVEIDEDYDKVDYSSFMVRCIDYTRLLDSRLVVQTYQNMTAAAIIEDIKNNFMLRGFTTNNVNVTTLIPSVTFNYEYPSQCIKQLADMCAADWYVDYNKDIHFFSTGAVSAPFNLSDTGGKYIYESLRIRRNLAQLRNTIFVRGGEYLADTITAAYIADGSERFFFLPHKFTDLKLVVTGQIKSVGIDNIDQETGFDALHNFQEKVVKFRSDKKPTVGSDVRISGRPNQPVLVKLRDQDSIDTFTAKEHVIIDKSINTKEGARQRALAELLLYKTTISEGEFDTYSSGLRSGQTITIQSTARGLSEEFVINKVSIQIFGTNAATGTVQLVYRVSLVTTRTFDHIQLLLRLMNQNKKDIVISDQEVLDTVESISEVMSFVESISSSISHNPITETMTLTEYFTGQPLDYPTEFVVGPWVPGSFHTDYKRQFITDGSPLRT